MAPSAIETIKHYEPIVLNRDKSITNCFSFKNGAEYASELVQDALKERIKDINTDDCEEGEDDAFFVADMGEVYRQHLRWKMNLKRVKPHYGELDLVILHILV